MLNTEDSSTSKNIERGDENIIKATNSESSAKSIQRTSKKKSDKKLSPLAQPSLIVPRIYISSKTAAYHQSTIENLKITHIISIHEHAKPAFEALGVKYLTFTDIDDKPEESEKLKNIIQVTNNFLHEALTENAENTVLLHCNAGASRSVTVLAFYFMTVGLFNEDSETVMSEIKKRRFQACPNAGFRKILAEYENSEHLMLERKKLSSAKSELVVPKI